MIGIPFLKELFTAILQESMVMQGRFFICPDWASEINTNTIDDVVTAATDNEKYSSFPAVFMMPPTLTGDLVNPDPARLTYALQFLFLTTSYYDSNNNVKAPDQSTGSSTHTIPMDWHDMQRCAVEFCRMIGVVLDANNLLNVVYPSQREPQQIQMISKIGTKRLSGVSVTFNMVLFTTCAGDEDYAPDAIARINFTAGDSHPAHTH